MDRTKLIFGVGTVVLIIMLTVAPGVISTSSRMIKKDSEVMTTVGPIYVGDMYIEGTGDHSTAIVMATAEQNLRVGVDSGGSDVVIEAKYKMQCLGLFDFGYAELYVQGAEEKEVDTNHCAEGYLYTTVYDCKWGDTINWVLTVIYDDLFFPYPLVDFDGGGGICNSPLVNSGNCRLNGNQMTISGSIVCK